MKLIALTLMILMLVVGIAPSAQARGYVSVGIGCCGGYYPYYAPYYGYPAYYYPPAPTVVYTQPAPTYVVQQPVPYYSEQPPAQTSNTFSSAPNTAYAPPVPVTPSDSDNSSTNQAQLATHEAAANAATPTFVDDKGRTCRKFQTMIDTTPITGTACLQKDGSWRSVDE